MSESYLAALNCTGGGRWAKIGMEYWGSFLCWSEWSQKALHPGIGLGLDVDVSAASLTGFYNKHINSF